MKNILNSIYKHFCLICTFLVILFVFGCDAKVEQSETHIEGLKRSFEQRDNGPIMTVAHRGCWSIKPENTVAALNYCVDLGIDVMEIDVQLTADKKLVVFHDRTLDRMTDATGYLAERTLGELKQLNLYERDGTPAQLLNTRIMTHHKIATLAELMQSAKGKIFINLEIKSNKYYTFEQVFYAAKKLVIDMGLQDHVLWKIPSPSAVYKIKMIGDFYGDNSKKSKSTAFVSQLDLTGLPYVMPIINNSERSFAQKLQDYEEYNQVHNKINSLEVISSDLSLAYWPLDNGKIIGADKNRYMAIALLPRWSSGLTDEIALKNPDSSWGRLIDMGFDMIMTDRPEQLVDYVRKRNTGRTND